MAWAVALRGPFGLVFLNLALCEELSVVVFADEPSSARPGGLEASRSQVVVDGSLAAVESNGNVEDVQESFVWHCSVFYATYAGDSKQKMESAGK